jgi:hypothetical protein
MKSSSKGGEFSGLYRRGKKFWFRYRHEVRVHSLWVDFAESAKSMACNSDCSSKGMTSQATGPSGVRLTAIRIYRMGFRPQLSR